MGLFEEIFEEMTREHVRRRDEANERALCEDFKTNRRNMVDELMARVSHFIVSADTPEWARQLPGVVTAPDLPSGTVYRVNRERMRADMERLMQPAFTPDEFAFRATRF